MSARATGLTDVDDAPIHTGQGGSGAQGQQQQQDAERRASHARAGGSQSGGAAGAVGAVRAAVFDWSRPLEGLGRFDAVLACDVLYEADAVEPIAGVVPALLRPTGGALLLADPPNRTAANRERFLELLRGGKAPFALEECYQHE